MTSSHIDMKLEVVVIPVADPDRGEYDVNWPDWYAEFMVAERAGTELPV